MIALAARLVRPSLFLSPAFPFDADPIAQLLRSAPDDCVPIPSDEVGDRLSEFAVARTPSGQVLGCAAVRPLDEERAELRGLVVRDDWRGAGVGRLLVEDAVERAAGKRQDLFCVSRSPGFFENMGFERLGPESVPARPGVRPGGKPRVALLHRRDQLASTHTVRPSFTSTEVVRSA